MAQPILVLLVDDEHSVKDGIEALLMFADDIAVVGKASNGREALLMTANLQPSVVLMDVRMPIMDGIEATRRIKDRWPHVKVVVLTMYPDGANEALAVGADRIVLKGDRRTDLAGILRQLVTNNEVKTATRNLGNRP